MFRGMFRGMRGRAWGCSGGCIDEGWDGYTNGHRDRSIDTGMVRQRFGDSAIGTRMAKAIVVGIAKVVAVVILPV